LHFSWRSWHHHRRRVHSLAGLFCTGLRDPSLDGEVLCNHLLKGELVTRDRLSEALTLAKAHPLHRVEHSEGTALLEGFSEPTLDARIPWDTPESATRLLAEGSLSTCHYRPPVLPRSSAEIAFACLPLTF
jgi:hypothetical protein